MRTSTSGALLNLLLLSSNNLFASARLTSLHPQYDNDAELERPTALPCEKPVSKAPVKFPSDLLLAPQEMIDAFDMYSGYVNVTSQDYLFYWLAEKNPLFPTKSLDKQEVHGKWTQCLCWWCYCFSLCCSCSCCCSYGKIENHSLHSM